MKNQNKEINSIDYLIQLINKIKSTEKPSTVEIGFSTLPAIKYDEKLFSDLKNESESLALRLFGKEHSYYIKMKRSRMNLEARKKTLNLIKNELV